MDDEKDDHAAPQEEMIRIANEFAEVIIRKVYTRCGERIEITAPRSNFSVRLDPLELEALTWQTKKVFSDMLRGSNGPPRGDGVLP